jgi:hypothetical protein
MIAEGGAAFNLMARAPLGLFPELGDILKVIRERPDPPS